MHKCLNYLKVRYIGDHIGDHYSFLKRGVSFWGVLIIEVVLFGGLYWGSPHFGKLPFVQYMGPIHTLFKV